MIVDEINDQISAALKSGDRVRLETLKMLSAALKNAEIAKKREKLTSEEELKVVKSEAKKRKDAIEQYGKVTVSVRVREKIDREKNELEILQEYLPAEMSDEELEKIVSSSIDQIGADSMTDMGKVMGLVMKEVEGKADGSRVSTLVKEKLT